MRHLNVGGTTYDTVGEASVTQVLSSGTKIATVSIDGTATDLYAPAGGSSVDPATAAPSMDGTAAVGSSAKYAREDHVHPHDTSKLGSVTLSTSADTYVVPVTGGTANIDVGDGLNVSEGTNKITLSAKTGTTSTTVAAGNHTHTVAGINGLQSALDAKQATLVSGMNIKTVNGTSLLGSGDISTAELPSVSSSDDGKVLTVTNGAWAAGTASGGGGVSVLTLYVDNSKSNLWVDKARTETLCSHYDYDLSAIQTALAGFDVIRVFWPGMSKMSTVLLWVVDTADEDFYVDVAVNTKRGKLVNNATEYTFETVERIYPS